MILALTNTSGTTQSPICSSPTTGRPALVNLIPFNPVAELPYTAPRSADVARFADELRAGGLLVKIRYRKGSSIDAACGQLRRRQP